MTIPDYLSAFTQALGWTLVHSLWQITLIYLLFKLAGWFFQHQNRAYYNISVLAMCAAAIWSGFTFFIEYQLQVAQLATVNSVLPSVLLPPAAYAPPSTVYPPPSTVSLPPSAVLLSWLDAQSALLGWAWCLGVLFLSLRLMGGYWLAQRLRRRGITSPEQRFLTLCKQWSERIGIHRKVQLFESKYLTEPMTLGFWKPVVLFPAGMLLQLSPAQVEALLLHELAHIRRYDYLVNLFQLTLDVCFFYHPLFQLLSKEARNRREFCCDDFVLKHTNDRLLYARTLTELKLHPIHLQNAFVMTATGQNNFSARILRIAGITPQRSQSSNLFGLLLLLGGIAGGAFWPAVTQAEEKSASESSSTKVIDRQLVKDDTVPPSQNRRAQATRPVISPNEGSGVQTESMPGVAVELSKMNVVYIGVDNPLQIAVNGIPTDQLSLRMNGNGTISGSKGNYIARFTEPGETHIEVYRKQNGKENLLTSKAYRIKRIPDPIPMVAGRRGGSITADKFVQEGKNVAVLLQNFDFDVICDIVEFEITNVPMEGDPITFASYNASIPPASLEMISKLTPGSKIFIDDIKVKCPGDKEPRNLGGLMFKIQ